MEIRFSRHHADPLGMVECCVGMHSDGMWGTARVRGQHVRFALHNADSGVHDRVIRALLQLDPDATVRTARAVYEGLEDFQRQRGK